MSIDLNPREVLKYLNQLGYYNISGQQLKEFIKDLKTLIKYDEKQNKPVNTQNKENVHFTMRQSSSGDSETDYVDNVLNVNRRRNDEYLANIANTLYSSSTVSSQAKTVPKKQININVHKVNKNEATSRSTRTSDSNIFSSQTSRSQEYCRPPVSEVQSNKTKPCRTKSSTSQKTYEYKPRVSFIRPRQPVKICKSDPVAMYQQYQEEWKKQKIPGENKHYDLRWAVRERMLGGVHSQNN